jgi:hypothetical protein
MKGMRKVNDSHLANEKAAHAHDEAGYNRMMDQAHADADAGKDNKARKELPKVTPMPGRGHKSHKRY